MARPAESESLIDSLADTRLLLADLALDEITVSMTINATASVLLLLYQLVAKENGVDPASLAGTIQNDVLKEYVARGTYIYPPAASMRITTDIFEYCLEQLPRWNTISVSGYHIREAGSTAVQELAFTLANGIAYVSAAIDANLDVDAVAERMSFFWNAHNNLFEEIAKFRAARRMWARIMTERFAAKSDRAKLLRFHTQTGGSTLTAQQPDNNIVRVALQALAAVLGGTQSLHTNGYDEALGLPTVRSAKVVLRTQQIIATETGVIETVDPLAGSFYVESLTDQIEAAAWQYIDKIDAIRRFRVGDREWIHAGRDHRGRGRLRTRVDRGDKLVVGINTCVDDATEPAPVFPVDPEAERRQVERTHQVRANRNGAAVDAALAEPANAARGNAKHSLSDEGSPGDSPRRSARSAMPYAPRSASTTRPNGVSEPDHIPLRHRPASLGPPTTPGSNRSKYRTPPAHTCRSSVCSTAAVLTR